MTHSYEETTVTDKAVGFSFSVLLVVALVMVGIMQLVAQAFMPSSSPKESNSAAVLERIKPIGQLNTGAPIVVPPTGSTAPASEIAVQPTAPAQPPSSTSSSAAAQKSAGRSGEQVYNTVCQICHGAGVAGAPKLGDKGAWDPRIQQGMPILVQHAVKGFTGKKGVMPPRGTCGNCSDEELKSAVEYMVSKSK